MGYGYKNPYEELNYKTKVIENEAEIHLEEPFRDVFIWALLSLRFRIALLLWKRLKHPLSAALVAYKVINNQIDHTDNREKKEFYKPYAK